MAGANPRFSAWSVITRKSSGTREPGLHAGARRHLLAEREAVRRVRSEAIAGHSGIGGIARVQMRVAEQHAIRKVLPTYGE